MSKDEIYVADIRTINIHRKGPCCLAIAKNFSIAAGWGCLKLIKMFVSKPEVEVIFSVDKGGQVARTFSKDPQVVSKQPNLSRIPSNAVQMGPDITRFRSLWPSPLALKLVQITRLISLHKTCELKPDLESAAFNERQD